MYVRTYVRTYVAVPRVVGENILGVFLAVPRVVGENILGVFLAVLMVVGENILEFFLFWELQGTDAAPRARMQRRGHTGRAHYKPARRTYVQP